MSNLESRSPDTLPVHHEHCDAVLTASDLVAVITAKPCNCGVGGSRAIQPGYVQSTEWPCRKCRSTNLAKRSVESSDGAYGVESSDGAYDDYHFICLDCGNSWLEESSDY